MKRPRQEFVLRCGKLFLGHQNAARVSSVERAVRFRTREIAEMSAEMMRGNGLFKLPWEVVELGESSLEGEAA